MSDSIDVAARVNELRRTVRDAERELERLMRIAEGARAGRSPLATRSEELEADIVVHRIELERAIERQVQDQAILRIAGRIARVGGWHVTIPGLVLTWSDETAAIHEESPGFSPASIDAAIAYYAPEHRDTIRRAFDSCWRDGTPFDLQLQLITAKGKRLWVRAIGEAVRGPTGEITHCQGAFQDISRQKADAEQIHALSMRLLDTLENLTDGFFTLDRNWTVTYVNAEAERLLQRSREEILGENLWAKFPGAVGTESDVEYHRAMDEGEKTLFEQFYPPLGKWFEAEAQATRDGIAVYFRDVTERRRQRESLQEQATLLDKATDAIIVRDLDHHVRFWNKGAERLYGYTAVEAKGRSIAELLYTDPRAFRLATETVLAKGEWTGEIEQVTKDRRPILVEGRWTLVRDEQGDPKSILAINTDITLRKKLEAQYLRAQRIDSLGALAGGIAHDLNNALAPIVFGISAMRGTEKDPHRAADLAMMETCALRGADMVKQLLTFARGADGRKTKVDVGKVAREIQKLVKETFPKDITLELSVEGGLWPVSADETQLHQVLTNLCVNARDAMPKGGTLTIAIEHVVLDEVYAGMNVEAKPGPYVRIRVEDTGTGMPQDVLEQIFEPFFTTKELGKGTGLGLSTVHAIVRNHGGFVHAYSEVGKGTRFEIHLPAETSRKVADQTAVAQSMLPRGNGELILVVDDEASIRTVARHTLERFGYRVVTASNGAEAIAVYTQNPGIAAVLTDMTMPVMDGPATIVALKALDPKVRIIGSSGLGANGHVAKAVGAGVAHFVPKPYTAEAILKALKKILSER